MGEVHTVLLHHSRAVTNERAAQLLEFVQGEQVRRSDRPFPYVRSPEMLSGIDCPLPTASGPRVRGIGTVISRATITGGHVVQGSAHLSVVRAQAHRRLAWSHYLARRGVVEAVGKVDAEALVDGFLSESTESGTLNLAAVSAGVLDGVQRRDGLDHRPALRPGRTVLRWASLGAPGDTALVFGIGTDQVRRVRLPWRAVPLGALVELCEDVALHDWLLTALLGLVERSRIGSVQPAEVVRRLRPAIDHLLHLWMPAARVDESLADLWQALEHRPGLTRQWRVNVDRVRDQLTLGAMEKLRLL
jgi:hypothetical protein